MALLYGDLRRIAARYLTSQRQNHTLQPTALMNEAYLKPDEPGFDMGEWAHFLAAAAR